MVAKPAHETPLSALALVETAHQAGLPAGVFNVLPAGHDNLKEISPFFCESEDVSCITFTGSTRVGKVGFMLNKSNELAVVNCSCC